MRVQTPPNIAANDRGMRNREALVPVSRATPRTIGRKMATAAVLLIKAEMRPMVSIMVVSASQKLLLPTRARYPPSAFTAPDR